MKVAYELHVPEEEVLTWPVDKVLRWMAFFKLEDEQKQRRGGIGGGKPTPSRPKGRRGKR